MHTWILLITSLPTENATARMRAWRSLKASGATVLRDGVYLMPEREDCRATLESVATDVRAADGTALVVRIEEPSDGNFVSLFDRSADFANLLGEISLAREGLHPESANDVLKQARRLRKTFTNLVAIDFFPGEAQKQADEALRDLVAFSAPFSEVDHLVSTELRVRQNEAFLARHSDPREEIPQLDHVRDGPALVVGVVREVAVERLVGLVGELLEEIGRAHV